MMNFCFSFHGIPFNDKLIDYRNSDENEYFEWEGVKLQMIAEALFDFSQELTEVEMDLVKEEENVW